MIPAIWPDWARMKVLSVLPICLTPVKLPFQFAMWSVSQATAHRGKRTSDSVTLWPNTLNVPCAKPSS